MSNPQIIYVSGLPHAGANLLCHLLGQHPEIDNAEFTSPLCEGISQLRSTFSSHPLFQIQTNADFDQNYFRFQNALQGLLNGWFGDRSTEWVIDRNGAWLTHLELVRSLNPNFRMLVCVRELGQICGSLETQHQKTLLLDYPEPLAHLSRAERTKRWFEPTGVVGTSLSAIEALQDMDESFQQNLYYVVFEHLISEPAEVVQGILDWLGLPTLPPDLQQFHVELLGDLSAIPLKYREPVQTLPTTNSSSEHCLPDRFEVALQQNFRWFYQMFYPGQLKV